MQLFFSYFFVWKGIRRDLLPITGKTLGLFSWDNFFSPLRIWRSVLPNFAILHLVVCIVENIYFAVLFSKRLDAFFAEFVSLVFPFIITMSCTDIWNVCTDDTTQHSNVKSTLFQRCFNVEITFIRR